MKIKLKVEYSDGTTKPIVGRFGDFVAFERTWNRSVTKFENELRLTDLAWIAWHVEKRSNPGIKTFDPDWLNDVETISIDDDDVEVESPLDANQQTGG